MIIDSEVSKYIKIAGKRYSFFSGNDYLGPDIGINFLLKTMEIKAWGHLTSRR
jgi:hypothetical protein